MSKQKSVPKDAPKIPLEEEEIPAPKRRLGWMLGLGGGAILAAGSTILVTRQMFFGFEERIFHFVNFWPDSLRNLFLVLTIAPESLWIALAAVLITFVLKKYRATWELAAATVAGYGIVFVAKELVGRARPEQLLHDVSVRVAESSNGFPSGHTMITTIITLILWSYLPRGWRWLPIVLLVPAMALSRIYLGVHMPLDVIGGFAVGVAVVCAMRSLPQKLREWLKFI